VTHSWVSPLRLLIAAAILHVAVTAAVFACGRYGLMPATFDAQGTAVSFARDGVEYAEDATTLADFLQRGEVVTWARAPYPFHIKPYSICFAVFGPLLGPSILTAEPLNLIYYLGILMLVYKLGKQAFGLRAGLVGSAIVALWPSFLLHTTQLLKDPIFILGMLALILTMMLWLKRPYSWRKSLLSGAGGAFAAIVIWKTRPETSEVLMATLLLGSLMLLVRQIQLRRILAANLTGMILLIALMVGGMVLLPTYNALDHPRRHPPPITNLAAPKRTARWWQVGTRIDIVRQRFIQLYPASSSNIDTDVRLGSTGALIRYLPRAAAIGLFAPFPNMWFGTGTSVGSTGRILSGVETLLMYGIECLALAGLWRGRRRIPVWFLFSVALMGTLALGLVVVNIGTLYRFRYVFLILLIIIAADRAAQVFDRFGKSEQSLSLTPQL
jgi:hypothetical protein